MKYLGIRHKTLGPLSLKLETELSEHDGSVEIIKRYDLVEGRNNLYLLNCFEEEEWIRSQLEKVLKTKPKYSYNNDEYEPYHDFKLKDLEIYEVEIN